MTPGQRRELYAAWAFVVVMGVLGLVGLCDMALRLWRAL